MKGYHKVCAAVGSLWSPGLATLAGARLPYRLKPQVQNASQAGTLSLARDLASPGMMQNSVLPHRGSDDLL